MKTIIIIIIIAYLLLRLLSSGRKERIRRPPFKKLYDLDRFQPISEFEEKMIQGMFNENKEVFVTAFVKDAHVLKVTATIGSKYKCGASDNLDLWGEKAVNLGATKIRQYHCHPDVFGRSFPSNIDKQSHRAMKSYLDQWKIEYQSLLVYKSRIGGTRIKEYY